MQADMNNPYVRGTWRLLVGDNHFYHYDGYFPSELRVGDLDLRRRQEFIVLPTIGATKYLVKQRFVLWRPHHWKVTFSVARGSMRDDVVALFPGGVAAGTMWIYKVKVEGEEFWEKDMIFLKLDDLIDTNLFETLPVPGPPASDMFC